MRFCLLLALILSVAGCQRPQGVTEAQAGAEARVENYATNAKLIVGGYRSAYVQEAKGHIDTKRAWSVERMETQIKAGTCADGTPVTPEKITAGYADVYAKRDAAILAVAQEVAAATAQEQVAEKDLTNARKLFASVHSYDETPSLSIDAVPAFVELLTPFVEKKGAANGGK